MTDEKITEQEIHLSDYYLVLLKHRFLILACLVLTVAVTLFFTLRMDPVFQSSTTLVIESPQITSPLTGERVDYQSYYSQNLTFNTHFKLITSRPVLERVIDELRLDRPENSDKLSPSPFQALLANVKENVRLLLGREKNELTPEEIREQIIEDLRGRIEIKEVRDTRLLQIAVEDTDPVLARDIANTLGRAYIRFDITNRMLASRNSFQTMRDQSYELKKKLEDAEQDFLKFKQRERLFSISGKQEVISQRISEFSELAVRNRNELQELSVQLGELQSLSTGNRLDVVRIRSMINNPMIDRLNQQLIESEIGLSKLRKVYRDKHPKVVQILGRISDTRTEILNQLDKELANMKNRRTLLLAKEKNLRNNIDELEQEALALSRKEVRYTALQRNVDTSRKLYDTLLDKLSESDVTESLGDETIRVVETAQVAIQPVRPKKRRNILLAVVLGLFGGIGLAFFMEYLDQTLHTEEDVQQYLGLPVLTVVPVASQAGKGYGYYSRKGGTSSGSKEKG
ncbi:MAG: GumC family protein [Desulfobacterales bacterium]|nr:GumC family protein [Desulfobacterales bacterium]